MGKFVYKNKECMDKMHVFYDKALESLNINYEEQYVDTTFGKTHVLIIGDTTKRKLITLHGGNGISPLNIRIFIPLLKEYCVIAPDVIGMPGKSEPYRNLNTNKDDYGLWLGEVMDNMNLMKCLFAVSSYSAAMLLSFAQIYPDRIEKALLLVPSGIAHGKIAPMISKMVVPFMKYYIKPDTETLKNVVETMVTESDDLWCEFLDIMMSSYKMEMRPPREFSKKELKNFNADIILFASENDIFFPASKVFGKAKLLFTGNCKMIEINSKHLPDEKTMKYVCKETITFFNS